MAYATHSDIAAEHEAMRPQTEDAELNALADSREDGPFVSVDLDDL